ncbi:TPA: hypothetical protein J1W26_004494 [Escherichia coli]|nr:hypothetical protein [Escherichia coli]
MKKLLLLTFLTGTCQVSWASDIPDCTSEEVTNSLINVLKQWESESTGGNPDVYKEILESRPASVDKDVKKITCRAKVHMMTVQDNYPGYYLDTKVPIEYTAQYLKNDVYIEFSPKEFVQSMKLEVKSENLVKISDIPQSVNQKNNETPINTTHLNNTSSKSSKAPSCSDDNAVSSLRETFVEDFQDSQLKDAFYEMNLFSITDSVLVKAHSDANECKGDVEWIVDPDKKPAYVPIYYSFYADGRITYDRDAFWSEIKKAETAGKYKNPTVFPKNTPPSKYTYSVNQNQSATQKSVEMTKYKNLTDNKKYGSSVISLNSKDNTLQINGTTNPDNPMSTTCDITGNIANEFKQNGNQYDLTKGSCNVTVVIGNTEGTVKIKGNCQDYCGVNGDPNVLNGQYK